MRLHHLAATAIFAFGTLTSAAQAQTATIDQRLSALASNFDHVNYEVAAKPQKDAALASLLDQSKALARDFPARAEPLAWEGIILSVQAKENGGMGALPLANQSKQLLEQAIHMSPSVLNGGGYASLGTLYAHVPGFPISFGDKAKATQNLQRALAISPNDIEANYFYADVLLAGGNKSGAIAAAQKAVSAPARPGRAVGDRGRRAEASALIARAR
jgi:tetratricopeptide (TPR) repeat protein